MLDDCITLEDCEKRLTEPLKRVRLIGQLELADADATKLEHLIAAKLSRDPVRAVQSIIKNTPASLASFLVWMGQNHYQAGDFWTPVRESLRLPVTPDLTTDIGYGFLIILKKFNLPTFDSFDGPTYVKAILAHCGIPTYCLSEFFELVLVPLSNSRQEINNHNIESAIANWQQSSHYWMVSKPVSRFLLSGEDVAHQFLLQSLELLTRSTDSIQRLGYRHCSALSSRVVQELQAWLTNTNSDYTSRRTQSSRAPRPEVFFDPLNGEIKLFIPPTRFPLGQNHNDVEVALISANGEQFTKRLMTRLRSQFVETLSTFVPIELDSDQLLVSIRADGEEKKSWIVRGPGARHFLLFDSTNLTLLPSTGPFESPLWLLHDSTCELQQTDDVHILERGSPLFGFWSSYTSCLISCKSNPNLLLQNDDSGSETSISLSFKSNSAEMIDHHAVPATTANGSPVYSSWPFLRIIDQEDFTRLEIRSSTAADITTISLTDRPDDPKQLVGATLVPLAMQNSTQCVDSCTATLYKKNGDSICFNYSIIPDLVITRSSSAPLTPSHSNKKSPVTTLRISSDHLSGLQIHPPASLKKHSATTHVVSIPADLSAISYSIPTSPQEKLQLVTSIPRLRIGVAGISNQSIINWTTHVPSITANEFFESKDPYLWLDIPQGIASEAILQLAGSTHRDFKIWDSESIAFDLRQFSTSAKNSKNKRREFHLYLKGEDDSYSSFPVLEIRPDWIIQNVIFEPDPDHQEIYLAWEQVGAAENPILRAWNLLAPWQSPIELELEEGETHTVLGMESLSDGPWRLQFDTRDEWGSNSDLELIPTCDNYRVFDQEVGAIWRRARSRTGAFESLEQKLSFAALSLLLGSDKHRISLKPSDITSNDDALTAVRFTAYLISSGRLGERLAHRLWYELPFNEEKLDCEEYVRSALTTIRAYLYDNVWTALLNICAPLDNTRRDDEWQPPFSVGQLLRYPKYGVGRYIGIKDQELELEYLEDCSVKLKKELWTVLEPVSGFRRLDRAVVKKSRGRS